MSSFITSVVLLPTLPGIDIRDLSTAAGKVWQAALDKIIEQPACQRLAWGFQEENKDMITMLIGKSSVTYPMTTNTLVERTSILTIP